MGLYTVEINEDELEDYDHIVNSDKWEDGDFVAGVNEKYPDWYLVKMPGYSTKMFVEVKEWLEETGNICYGKYETVGWSSGCAYSIGVVFENGKDAMIFKLRWR